MIIIFKMLSTQDCSIEAQQLGIKSICSDSKSNVTTVLILICVSSTITGQPQNSIFIHSVAEKSRHSVLSGDRIQQCATSSGSRHKDTLCYHHVTMPQW